MPKQNEKPFQFAPLEGYSFKQRWSIRLADNAFYWCIRILGATTRFEVRGLENWESIAAAGKHPIYTFWHDRIFLGTYFWRDRGIVIMTSQSFDGEYIARFIQRFGFGAIRGSSSKGGVRALIELIRLMHSGHPAGFAVDGPRGPKYEVKPGPVFAAKKSGNPIMPFVIEAKHYWTVNSWDKMQIPKPFSKALLTIGEPIYVSSKEDNAGMKSILAELQKSLDDLLRQGREWRERND